MSHPVDSTHPVEPSIARMTEEAAKQKAVATQEKRELAGDADFHDHKHLDNVVNNPNALLENPLQVRLARFARLARPPLPQHYTRSLRDCADAVHHHDRVSRTSASRVSSSPPVAAAISALLSCPPATLGGVRFGQSRVC